jgi:hypothetical protein
MAPVAVMMNMYFPSSFENCESCMREGVQAPGREREREEEEDKKSFEVQTMLFVQQHTICFFFQTLPEHFCSQNLVYTSPDKQIDCILWSGGGQGC